MQATAQPVRSKKEAPSASRVTRPVTLGSPEDLAPYRDEDRLATGEVTLLSLEAITEKLGAEWQARRAEAYDRANRVLKKRICDGGAFLRISETDFLLVQPGLGDTEAEDAALRFLTEVVTLFIPDPAGADLRLFRVASIAAQQVSAAPRDAETIRRAADAARANKATATAALHLLSEDRWSPFVASDGRRVRPSCVLEPVFELASNNRIGYRLRRRVIDMATGTALSSTQVYALSRADILRIDLATIARGMARVQATPDGGSELSLIIPLSYLSLTSPEGVARLSLALGQARQAVRAGVICEICDIDGVSPAALAAAVAVIRPWSLVVVGHLADEKPRASAALKAAGIQVLSVNCPASMEGDAEFLGWLRTAMKSSKAVGRSTIVYGCTSSRRLAMAGLAGASHAGMAAREDYAVI